MAICMEAIVAVGDNLYARDQWGRVWIHALGRWTLTAAPTGTVWIEPNGMDARPVTAGSPS